MSNSDGVFFEINEEVFFEPKGFIPRLRKTLSNINHNLTKSNRQAIKTLLNYISNKSHELSFKKNDKLKVHLLFLNSYTHYAYFYESEVTFKNVLKHLEKGEYWKILSSKYTFEYKYLKAKCYSGLFNIVLLQKKNRYSIKDLELLLSAKSLLLSVYVNHIDNKVKPTELLNVDLGDILIFLSKVLTQLNRWSEAYHYLDELDKIGSKHKSNSIYLKSILLHELKEFACLDYNVLLLLELLDNYTELKDSKHKVDQRQLESLDDISCKAKTVLDKNNIDIKLLRKHKAEQIPNTLNKYESFVKSRNLYINEHTFFCDCKDSCLDNLTIKTSHKHTQKNWLEPVESLLNKVIADYSLARNEYYLSFEPTPLKGQNLNSINRQKVFRENYKTSLLLSSFKGCYSILDTIAHIIIKSLVKLNVAQKQQEDKNSKLYFLNFWEIYNVDQQIYIDNHYLYALKSISMDLSTRKTAALRKFKDIRNAIEHRTIIISKDRSLYEDLDFYIISDKSMRNKAEIILQLTKSAILSFTYFYRRLSKQFECENTV